MNVFRTFIIPAAQGPKAVAICNALGYPDKGMFTTVVADGPAPALDQPDTRTPIAYISSGIVDDGSLLLSTPAALFAGCASDPTITLADCQALIAALVAAPVPPLPQAAAIVSEVNGSAVTTPWVQPTGAQDAYNIGAQVTYGGKSWTNLMNANVWAPGVTGWRQFWTSGSTWLEWVQPLGSQDAYPLGAQVAHNGKHWQSLIAANVWEPGGVGTSALWVVVP